MVAATPKVILDTQVRIHTIQAGKGSPLKKPIFFFHGDRDDHPPLVCFTLSRTLGSKQPFYAVDCYNYGGEIKPTTLEDLATINIQAIRTIQPEGPYHLIGFCSGAFLVYEMARQLQAQGVTVASLILISPSEVDERHIFIRKLVNLCGTIFSLNKFQQQVLFLRIGQITRYVYRKTHHADNPHLKGLSVVLARDPKLNRMFPPINTLFYDYAHAFISLGSNYTPMFQPEHISFIWASENLRYRSRWSPFENPETSTIIDGYYMDMLDKNIHELVTAIQAHLNEIDTAL
ncbi:thioesterase domain-containing protein [Tengunoibacter tsumagoiensis]|uniref:Thioesterase domain-containing protein n=1 Tax=Tengunoibacter tsumagoiensis TaxID=2014871 RepID=A0A402A168_9CHLR|nr:alpha/beta fold hydrolase [Tengunoibacter tsumagoiensis]GCE12854.1 hypothetical protein KTT_27130 [Tengunoibacter tsumagoiensis]